MSPQKEQLYCDCVYGYHATDAETVANVLHEKHIKKSENWYDWLGVGSYFYQEAPLRALKWLTQEKHEGTIEPSKAGLLCAKIQIREFIDLLEPDWVEVIARTYILLEEDTDKLATLRRWREKQAEYKVGGEAGPHPLDKYVIDMAVGSLIKGGRKVNGVRAIFYDGKRLFENSHLLDRQHIQIAVHNWTEDVVEGLWEVDCQDYWTRL